MAEAIGGAGELQSDPRIDRGVVARVAPDRRVAEQVRQELA